MVNWTLGYGALMSAIGVGGFVATGAQHKTALIPAGFGVATLGLGVLARQRDSQRWVLPTVTAIGVLAVLGSARGLARLPALLSGEQLERPVAVMAQSAMAVLSAAYSGLCARQLLLR